MLAMLAVIALLASLVCKNYKPLRSYRRVHGVSWILQDAPYQGVVVLAQIFSGKITNGLVFALSKKPVYSDYTSRVVVDNLERTDEAMRGWTGNGPMKAKRPGRGGGKRVTKRHPPGARGGDERNLDRLAAPPTRASRRRLPFVSTKEFAMKTIAFRDVVRGTAFRFLNGPDGLFLKQGPKKAKQICCNFENILNVAADALVLVSL